MLSSLSPRISLCFSAAAFLLYVGMVRSRYTLFFHYVHWHPLITHHVTLAAPVDDAHASIPLTMIPSSTSSTIVGQFFWKKMIVKMSSWRVGDGSVNVGGTSLLGSVADGDISYLRHRPIWAYPSFVGLGRQWQTCLHIHLPFRL